MYSFFPDYFHAKIWTSERQKSISVFLVIETAWLALALTSSKRFSSTCFVEFLLLFHISEDFPCECPPLLRPTHLVGHGHLAARGAGGRAAGGSRATESDHIRRRRRQFSRGGSGRGGGGGSVRRAVHGFGGSGVPPVCGGGDGGRAPSQFERVRRVPLVEKAERGAAAMFHCEVLALFSANLAHCKVFLRREQRSSLHIFCVKNSSLLLSICGDADD